MSVWMAMATGLVVAGCSASLPTEPSTAAVTKLGSTSLCADSYLLALAPDRVSALSWQAGSALSTAKGPLLQQPRLWDSREVVHASDLQLVTGPGGRIAGDVPLRWGEDFDAVADNLVALAEASGRDASAWLARIEATTTLPQPGRKPRVLYLSRTGASAGAGTFVDAVITRAGGTNAAPAPGWHSPGVEALLGLDPDIVLTSFFDAGYDSASDRALRHAALRDFIAARPRIDVPGKLWPCAGPGLVEATEIVNRGILDWSAAP